MASKKEHGLAVSPGTEAISTELGSPADVAIVPAPAGNGSAAERMAKARAAKGKAKKRDLSNRPFYLCVGRHSGSMHVVILDRFETKGRAIRWMDNKPNYVLSNYDRFDILRCKEVEC